MASFIQSAVGDSIARVKQDISSIPRQINSGIQGAIQNAKNNTTAAIRGSVNNAVNTGLNVVTQAAIAGIKGNFEGVANVLTNAPANILGNTVAGLFGKGASSLNLSGPLQVSGASSQLSGNGGVAEGDAFGGVLARSDPLLNFCWYCEMPQVPSFNVNGASAERGNQAVPTLLTGALSSVPYASTLTGSIFGGSVNSTAGTNAELPWYYIEEATLPFRVFNTRSIFREGRDRHYPDKYSVDNLVVGIYADTTNIAMNYLQAWNSAILRPFTAQNSVNEGGKFGRPSEYKQVIRFYVLSVAKQQVALIEYTECWPTSIDAVQMGSDSSDRVVWRVNFSVGDVFVSTFDVDTSIIAQAAENPLLFPTTIGGAISSIFNAGQQQATAFARELFS